MNMDR